MYLPGTCSNGTVAGGGITTSASSGLSGLGCPGCGGSCQGLQGLTMDGSGLFGTGIFGTGVTLTDLSTWTWAEYGTLALGAYVLLSLVHTTRAGARRVRRKAHGVRKGLAA
jgi:hypothetical protein